MVLKGNQLTLTQKNGIKLKIVNDLFTKAVLVRGDDKLPLGWYSPRYDVKIPTWTLHLKLQFNNSTQLRTFIYLCAE